MNLPGRGDRFLRIPTSPRHLSWTLHSELVSKGSGTNKHLSKVKASVGVEKNGALQRVCRSRVRKPGRLFHLSALKLLLHFYELQFLISRDSDLKKKKNLL
jgi:hypothetical protein